MTMKKTASTLVLLVLAVFALQAVTTTFYNDDSIREFQYGKLDRIMISEKGELSIAPEAKTVLDKGDLFVWDIIRGENGSAFAATGIKGRIYKISPAGKAALFYTASGNSVRALAPGMNGGIFAATSPDGAILSINSKGKAVKIATLKTSYIWDMIPDNRGGLYVATGNPAKIFRISISSGTSEVVYNSKKESHFLCLGLDGAGTLYFGSSGLGALYKKIRGQKTRLMYDSYEDEISCLEVTPDGRVFFGTASQRRRRPGRNFNYGSSVEFRESEQPVVRGKKRKKLLPLKNSVYMMDRGDKVRKLMTINKSSVYSLALQQDGSLLAGTGDYGVVYRISKQKEISRFLRLQENQVLCLKAIGSGIYAGTGNDGKVFVLKKGSLQKGIYTSRIFDCHTTVRWGTMSVIKETPDGTAVSMETRTGNSETPDKTWSPWINAPAREEGFRITSPGARYLQYRITLTSRKVGSSPIVQSVKIPFLRENRAPSIGRLVYKSGGTSKFKKKKKKVGSNTSLLMWTASDDDRDELRYAVYFRFNSDPYWRLLRSGLRSRRFIFHNNLLPDGWYRFKVVVSDHVSNSRKNALRGSKSTGKILIDNGNPVFKDLKTEIKGDRIIISGRIQDSLSTVALLRYSLNARSWRYDTPVDRVFDSKTESFRIVLDRKRDNHLLNGNNLLILRAADKSKNWAITKIFFNVPLKPGDAGTANDRIYFDLLEKETGLER